MSTEETIQIEAKEDLTDEDEALAEAPALPIAAEGRLKHLLELGAHYGLNKSKTNPKMRPFILATKSGVEIIDSLKTMEALDRAASFLRERIKEGGLVLLVGTTPAAKTLTKELGEELGLPYVTERWLGGTLTNFKMINNRLNHLRKMKEDKESGHLEKYTKKERLGIAKELDKFDKFFGGLFNLSRLPAAVLILDLNAHKIAAREARRLNIPTIATVNTNADPTLIDYPIPLNDRSVEAIADLLTAFSAAVAEGRKLTAEAEAVNKPKEENKEQING